jgi:hypothetical protein
MHILDIDAKADTGVIVVTVAKKVSGQQNWKSNAMSAWNVIITKFFKVKAIVESGI